MSELTQTEFNANKLSIGHGYYKTQRQGASSAEVDVGIIRFTVTARKGDVESVEYHQDKDVGITVYFGKRKRVQLACQICNRRRFDPLYKRVI